MSISYERYLDICHEREFQDDEELCTGCANEDCECEEIENFDIPEDEPDEYRMWAGVE